MPGATVISGSETTGTGPIRAVLTAQGRALAILGAVEGTSAANGVIREALQAGGDLWVEVFLPMRFTEYARRLGYYVTPGWVARKQKLTGQALPLVYLGGLRSSATAGAHATATAKKGGGTIRIRIPIAHGQTGRQGGSLQPKDQAVLRRIPDWEVSRVAAEVQRALIAALSGSVNIAHLGQAVSTASGRRPHLPTRKSA